MILFCAATRDRFATNAFSALLIKQRRTKNSHGLTALLNLLIGDVICASDVSLQSAVNQSQLWKRWKYYMFSEQYAETNYVETMKLGTTESFSQTRLENLNFSSI